MRHRIEYWADSGANRLAPGGSIQRIGYDQASFEEAFRVIAMEQDPTPVADGQEAPSRVGIIEKEDAKLELENGVEGEEEKKEGESGYKMNKEDLNYIVSYRKMC